MKKLLYIILTTCILCVVQSVKSQEYTVFCNTRECLENHKGQNAIIQGVLQIDPDSHWIWELRLSDKTSVLVSDTLDRKGIANFCSLVGKKVLIKGHIFYGIVAGRAGFSKEGYPYSHATGLRIDPDQIVIYSKKIKKEWMNK